jgi:hypothetical protein
VKKIFIVIVTIYYNQKCVKISNDLFFSGQQSFRLANIYSSGMVLQMAPKSTQIWGWGNVNASIKVQINSDTVYTSVGSELKNKNNFKL